jgi:large subunit ribosomal protein L18
MLKSKSKTYTLVFKRKKEGKTNYKKRIRYITSNKTRFVIRLSNKNIKIQGINFDKDGDLIIGTTDSLNLKNFGWKGSFNNMPSAYLTGLLFGKNIKEKVNEGIIDIGLRSMTKGGKFSAVIKGIVDSGIKVPHSEEIFPKEDKINGKVISEFSKSLKGDTNFEDLTKIFENVKKKILGDIK